MHTTKLLREKTIKMLDLLPCLNLLMQTTGNSLNNEHFWLNFTVICTEVVLEVKMHCHDLVGITKFVLYRNIVL